MILKRFCCCMSLRTGTLLIGIAGLMFTLFLLILLLATNVKLSPLLVSDPSGVLTKISVAFEMIVLIVISILLLIGGIKHKKWYLVPWLVVSVVTIAGIILTDIYSTALMFQDGNMWGGTILLVYGLMLLAVSVYCWIIVFSFFQQLAANEKRPGYT